MDLSGIFPSPSKRVCQLMKGKKEAIAKQTDFALKFAHRVAMTNAIESNFVVSPLGLHKLLCLVALGSEGESLAEVLSVLQSRRVEDLNDLYKKVVSFVFAADLTRADREIHHQAAIWIHPELPLVSCFNKVAKSVYRTHVEFTGEKSKDTDEDEATLKTTKDAVNSLIVKVTNSKEFLPTRAVNKKSKLVFNSVLRYRGSWANLFDVSKTRDNEFKLLNGSSIQVPFMTSEKTQFLSNYEDFQVLMLLHKQKDERLFSMYIFLPHAQDGLWNVYDKLLSGAGFLEQHRPSKKVYVGNFKLPKFQISFDFDASDTVKHLGVKTPFTSSAELTKMFKLRKGILSVSSMFNRSAVKVDEEGTEASNIALENRRFAALSLESPTDFVADHPFIFLIREERTGIVLFVGHLLNPLL